MLTSDHGEMFERGIEGHRTPVLYESVVRVPLLIFEPGRKSRADVYNNTSAADLLPTLLHVTDQKPAGWTEGIVLPPFASQKPDPERSVFVVQAEKSEQHRPLTIATIAIRKGDYKLMYFYGYEELGPGGERIELYNLKDDPEELNDLYDVEKEIAGELLNELKAKLEEMNAPYHVGLPPGERNEHSLSFDFLAQRKNDKQICRSLFRRRYGWQQKQT